MSYAFGTRITDGVISEPAASSRVSVVHPNQPPIKSYVEAAADYFVTKPSSSFVLAPPSEYINWNTQFGANPSSCSVKQTMGNLSKLYGFDDSVTWSPACVGLNCPGVGEGFGNIASSYTPSN